MNQLYRWEINMAVGSKEWGLKYITASTITEAVSKYLLGLDVLSDFPMNLDMTIRNLGLVEDCGKGGS